MSAASGIYRTGPRQGLLGAGAWYGLALLACLSVVILNGEPLFYFDTGGYLAQGKTALAQLGFPEPVRAAAGGAAGAATQAANETVNASRSAVYSILSAGLARFALLDLLTVLHAVIVILAVWLPARVLARLYAPLPPVALLVSLPLLVSVAGAMPFYVAYLMPDILAPVMLLVIATLTVFGREMRLWEVLLALAIGSFAVMSHLSHLMIAALMVPVAFLGALVLQRRRWWVPGLLALALVAVGVVEKKAFTFAAEAVSKSEVVYNPILTARLIQDGPGLGYLESHCPDSEIPTCALAEALSWSDDPYRLTATHIAFAKSAELGSFQLMTPQNQKIVADDQVGFFLDVLAYAPLGTALAFLRNTMVQVGTYSVEMTVPSAQTLERMQGVPGLMAGVFQAGRLDRSGTWLPKLEAFHGAVYAVSAVIIAALVLLPGGVPTPLRMLALVIVMGIVANALVCGGVSQPADRYGARVIWLLPFTAAFLLCAGGLRRGNDKPQLKGADV